MSTEREKLLAEITAAEAALADAESALSAFDDKAENNVYEDLYTALGWAEEKMRDQAHADCEGSYNCGNEEYTQEFMVGAQKYRATLKCEYNRHDKTYYYVEESTFTYEAI